MLYLRGVLALDDPLGSNLDLRTDKIVVEEVDVSSWINYQTLKFGTRIEELGIFFGGVPHLATYVFQNFQINQDWVQEPIMAWL